MTSHSAAHSRASSRSRLKKKAKSSVSIRASTTTPSSRQYNSNETDHTAPSGALTSEGFGHRKPNSHRESSLRIHTSDSSWLIQTGLALTEGSRETKGQSWIVKRESSTSLASPSYTALEDRPTIHTSIHPGRSARATPSISRRSSFKRGSRRSLAMTPALHTPLPMRDDELDYHPLPDWADDRTQAEIAAHVENEMADEFDYDGDPYGVLDFEGQFDSDDDDDDKNDEDEVRREILASRHHLGRWIDGIVDALLRLEDVPDSASEPNLDLEAANGRSLKDSPSDTQPQQLPSPKTEHKGSELSQFTPDDSVEPPPVQREGGLWDDVAWFGRLLARTVRS